MLYHTFIDNKLKVWYNIIKRGDNMGEITIKEIKNKWVLKVTTDDETIQREAKTLMEITTVLFEIVSDLKK